MKHFKIILFGLSILARQISTSVLRLDKLVLDNNPGAVLKCQENAWLCDSKSQCIDKGKRCDGIIDCQDSSDENCFTNLETILPTFNEVRLLIPELNYNDWYLTMCWGSLDNYSAHILCQQMGYTTILGIKPLLFQQSPYGNRTLDNIVKVRCNGAESSIQKCLISMSQMPCPSITTIKCGPCYSVLNVTSSTQTITNSTKTPRPLLTSPGFPTFYYPHLNCRWILQSSIPSTAIKITIKTLDLASPSVSGCENGYLRLHLQPIPPDFIDVGGDVSGERNEFSTSQLISKRFREPRHDFGGYKKNSGGDRRFGSQGEIGYIAELCGNLMRSNIEESLDGGVPGTRRIYVSRADRMMITFYSGHKISNHLMYKGFSLSYVAVPATWNSNKHRNYMRYRPLKWIISTIVLATATFVLATYIIVINVKRLIRRKRFVRHKARHEIDIHTSGTSLKRGKKCHVKDMNNNMFRKRREENLGVSLIGIKGPELPLRNPVAFPLPNIPGEKLTKIKRNRTSQDIQGARTDCPSSTRVFNAKVGTNSEPRIIDKKATNVSEDKSLALIEELNQRVPKPSPGHGKLRKKEFGKTKSADFYYEKGENCKKRGMSQDSKKTFGDPETKSNSYNNTYVQINDSKMYTHIPDDGKPKEHESSQRLEWSKENPIKLPQELETNQSSSAKDNSTSSGTIYTEPSQQELSAQYIDLFTNNNNDNIDEDLYGVDNDLNNNNMGVLTSSPLSNDLIQNKSAVCQVIGQKLEDKGETSKSHSSTIDSEVFNIKPSRSKKGIDPKLKCDTEVSVKESFKFFNDLTKGVQEPKNGPPQTPELNCQFLMREVPRIVIVEP